MAQSGSFDALVALGAVIRGDTYHFEVVSNDSCRAIMEVQLETGVPIALLHGSTLEEMQANGKALADYIADKTKPTVHASSESNQPPAPSGSSGDWVRDEFLKQKRK